MFKEITLYRFKRFRNEKIKLNQNDVTLFVGGNNSGKSTLLHAIAIWEFCKLILQVEKGESSLLSGPSSQGYGLAADEFLPVAIPTLKHLWTNLRAQKETEKDGYTLRIGCKWDLDNKRDCYLEFGLSLANDRLFIKTTNSNLQESDKIPAAVYLPTFAGLVDKENKLSVAERRRLVGKGMAGAGLRNFILDMYEHNLDERARLKGNKKKMSDSDLRALRQTDPFELLQQALRELFGYELKVSPFNDLYHTYIRLEIFKGKFKKKRFAKLSGYSTRDIMVEGTGLLQWLSVYSLALNPQFEVLLLDEPDAHLHSSLQLSLLNRLEELTRLDRKQVLIATHSPEIIKGTSASRILRLDGNARKVSSNRTTESCFVGRLGDRIFPSSQ